MVGMDVRGCPPYHISHTIVGSDLRTQDMSVKYLRARAFAA